MLIWSDGKSLEFLVQFSTCTLFLVLSFTPHLCLSSLCWNIFWLLYYIMSDVSYVNATVIHHGCLKVENDVNYWSISLVLACCFLYWKWSRLQVAPKARRYCHLAYKNTLGGCCSKCNDVATIVATSVPRKDACFSSKNCQRNVKWNKEQILGFLGNLTPQTKLSLTYKPAKLN